MTAATAQAADRESSGPSGSVRGPHTKAVEFEREGMLEGVHGPALAARERFLRELFEGGSTVEELREAAVRDRIALLPTERLLRGDQLPRYTPEEVAELAAVKFEDLRYTSQALGVPHSAAGVRIHSELDVEIARQLAEAMAAGLSIQAIAEVDRIMARGITPVVATARAVVEATLRPGMTEAEAAEALAEAASRLLPIAPRRVDSWALARVHAGHTLWARRVVAGARRRHRVGSAHAPDYRALATDRISRRGPHRVRAGPHSPAGAASVASSADAVSVLPIGGTPMAAAITPQLLEIRPLPELVEGPTIPQTGSGAHRRRAIRHGLRASEQRRLGLRLPHGTRTPRAVSRTSWRMP
ncbi:MAG: adenylate cyclase regulatory domain-containing protein [Solirubrobacteraceae bacterium]